ncbi:NAD(P)/FAD-dependent oxidoreductase [Arthrobacter bambusae]|uniref:NAD(P)/FAD-dependent oxidoreductase n=1 Tax=Arthrobacter bambusae TaxID=1338426 RepID=UPI00278A1A88|nr:NAD(P)/FAD-dependent oxidoreductase [Arthrobacter bambusae]MDQ0028449.1 hypothetical protein [Arthrobacter bambusae]MDQ0096756.1 hypothetical protein [Arthrobacter bambusae]
MPHPNGALRWSRNFAPPRRDPPPGLPGVGHHAGPAAPAQPYDRPPLSKQLLAGSFRSADTSLPRRRDIGATWRLGVAASSLDLATKQVQLADGSRIGFDKLLIATGLRSRPWPNAAEAALSGVLTLRTREDSAALRRLLAAHPRRVLVIRAGFIGCEVASVCRELGLPVTVAEAGPAPLVAALGETIGAIAGKLQIEHGVDLRCGVRVTSLGGDDTGQLRRAVLSDGTALEVDVAVAALGSVRNVEWLADSGLACGVWGVACDAGCRTWRCRNSGRFNSAPRSKAWECLRLPMRSPSSKARWPSGGSWPFTVTRAASWGQPLPVICGAPQDSRGTASGRNVRCQRLCRDLLAAA